MKDILITRLRDKNTTLEGFRSAANQLADLIAIESCSFIEKKYDTILTPIDKTQGTFLNKKIFLLPILRAGLIFLPSFLKYYPSAKVGFLGIKRDEKTALPHLYYEKLSNLDTNDVVFILDPMIATAGSSLLAIEILKKKGLNESQIKLIAIIASKEGILRLKTQYPSIETSVAAIDNELNNDKYITPGLGDFGDRYFSTI